jgi:hypothetical protein
VPISAGHRPYQCGRIHFSPGTLRYFLLYSACRLPPRVERACAERGGAAAPPGNQKPQVQSFGFTLCRIAGVARAHTHALLDIFHRSSMAAVIADSNCIRTSGRPENAARVKYQPDYRSSARNRLGGDGMLRPPAGCLAVARAGEMMAAC